MLAVHWDLWAVSRPPSMDSIGVDPRTVVTQVILAFIRRRGAGSFMRGSVLHEDKTGCKCFLCTGAVTMMWVQASLNVLIPALSSAAHLTPTCPSPQMQVAAGDTYRMKNAVKGDAVQSSQTGSQTGAVSLRSPSNSPMVGRLTSLPAGAVTTPFNRRVTIAYDTTASGRYLLKWAAENILEPADNVYVVRAVPKVRQEGLGRRAGSALLLI